MREQLSKRTRFEIFKRDGFRCVYCGATPVQAPLHVDHVVPVAEGGGNDPANLVTACDSCNLGKGAVPLEQHKFDPVIATEAQLEQVEQIRAYLALQEEIRRAKDDVIESLLDRWRQRLAEPLTLRQRIPFMLEQVGYEKVIEAIDSTAAKAARLASAGEKWTTQSALMYLNGCIRKMRRDAGR